jgi:hypothetical protein
MGSGRYFIRVKEDPKSAGFFLITYSNKIDRASFDAFIVDDAVSATLPHASFYGLIEPNPLISNQTSIPNSFRVDSGGGVGFTVAKGQLPLHEAQVMIPQSEDQPMFVVGPRAWETIHAQLEDKINRDDVSVFFSVRECGM